jgi:arylsulfatase A-like enzyme
MTYRFPVSLALIGLAWSTTLPAAESPEWNVILIVADDLGWADLGCYGSTFHATPNLDRLARSGMRFTQAYAACPVCSPSRAAIMTGIHPARLHLTDWLPGRPDRPSQKLLRPEIRQQLPLEETTIAEALKVRGYATASIGKWHLGRRPFWPEHQGFDVNIGGTETGSPPGGYFGFETPNLRARSRDENLTDRLSDEAVAFIERNRDRPFFAYLSHYAVHIPLQAKPANLARYRTKSSGSSPQSNPVYAAMIESLDDAGGRLLAALEKLAIADRTVVVFTSDNGGLSVKEGPNTPATSNAPLRAGKGYLYEGGIRVPLIVRWPGATRPGSVCAVPVSGQDLSPTLLDIAGGKSAPDQAIDGTSLVPLLKEQGGWKRSTLFWHYPHYSNQGGRPGGAVREGRLKLIEHYEDGRRELYDLECDPGERHDLAGERPGDADRLARLLAGWRQSVGSQMPRPNPVYGSRQHP